MAFPPGMVAVPWARATLPVTSLVRGPQVTGNVLKCNFSSEMLSDVSRVMRGTTISSGVSVESRSRKMP